VKCKQLIFIGAGLPIQIKNFTLFYCTFIVCKIKKLSKNIKKQKKNIIFNHFNAVTIKQKNWILLNKLIKFINKIINILLMKFEFNLRIL